MGDIPFALLNLTLSSLAKAHPDELFHVGRASDSDQDDVEDIALGIKTRLETYIPYQDATGGATSIRWREGSGPSKGQGMVEVHWRKTSLQVSILQSWAWTPLYT